MNDVDQIQMMRRCHDEIVQLRRQVEALEPRAIAYDHIAKVLDLIPANRSRGEGIDLTWVLKGEIEKLEAKRKAEAAAEGGAEDAKA